MENALVLSEKAQNQVMGSLDSMFADYQEKLEGIKLIADFVRGKDDLINYFTTGSAQTFMAERIFEFDPAKAALDADFWSKAINMTDVLECMTADKRNEWHKMIRERKTPAFDRETVLETIRSLLLSRGSFMAEKVDGIFQKLSGKHVTNSPHGFRTRMIIEYVVDKFGYVCHSRTEYIHDLRSVIAKLMDREEPKTYNTNHDISNIARAKRFGEWHDFDGGAFRIRLYKVGTAHMEIHPEIAVKLNLILSSLHPLAIASGAKKVSKKEKSIPLAKTILPYAVTYRLSSVADSLSRGRDAWIDKSELDKQTLKEVEEVLTFLGGTSKGGLWTFPYDASEVLNTIVRTGCLPEKVSHQFYPTKKDLAERVVKLIDPTEGDKILEPSAGHGAIAELLPKECTTCVEVSDVNSAILKQKGFNVVNADFLKWEPRKLFNKIVMNPPFAKGEAERHVSKASELLTNNGVLVAILPATLRGKKLVDGMTHTWSEVIEGAFDDTGVRVVILELTHSV